MIRVIPFASGGMCTPSTRSVYAPLCFCSRICVILADGRRGTELVMTFAFVRTASCSFMVSFNEVRLLTIPASGTAMASMSREKMDVTESCAIVLVVCVCVCMCVFFCKRDVLLSCIVLLAPELLE